MRQTSKEIEDCSALWQRLFENQAWCAVGRGFEEHPKKTWGSGRLWKKEYGALNGIDQEEFKITIISDVEETIHGKGVFPNNYQEFMELLGELNDKK